MAQYPCKTVEDAEADSGCHTGFGCHRCFILGNKGRQIREEAGTWTRELVKAYIHGLDSAALDDVFELLAWNQGIGYFSSEIGPSTLFQAYKTIKHMEKQGRERSEICEMLKEKFGEKNPDVKV